MACARDGFSNAQIHSLETNGGRGTDTRDLVYSTSLFSPVLKRLVTITCSIQTPGGIVAKKPQHAQNNQRSQQGKQGQQQKRGGKAQARAPRMSRRHPSAPGDRAATSSSPSAAPIWTRAAGTSATSSTSVAMLRGPSELWHGHHQPRTRRTRLQGGHHLSARLDRSRQHHRARRATPGLSRQRRQHGLHG